MKKFLFIFIFLISGLYAQTPLSLEEVKAIILQNANNLSEYKEGSVFQEISRGYQTTPEGKICEYETARQDTVLLASEQEDDEDFGPEIYLLMESTEKPITLDTCGGLVKTETMKMIFLISTPAPSLQWFANLKFEDEKYFQTVEGLIYSESDTEKCYYDFKMPLMYSEIRCEYMSGANESITTKMPDANLEVIYNELKELPIWKIYPSGPNESSFMELPKKFGEILQDWKTPRE